MAGPPQTVGKAYTYPGHLAPVWLPSGPPSGPPSCHPSAWVGTLGKVDKTPRHSLTQSLISWETPKKIPSPPPKTKHQTTTRTPQTTSLPSPLPVCPPKNYHRVSRPPYPTIILLRIASNPHSHRNPPSVHLSSHNPSKQVPLPRISPLKLAPATLLHRKPANQPNRPPSLSASNPHFPLCHPSQPWLVTEFTQPSPQKPTQLYSVLLQPLAKRFFLFDNFFPSRFFIHRRSIYRIGARLASST
ncbi:hypothetical protein BGZ63DRAFT_442379 [Mariannaea sp. PMI_226]|nr:hypothetical protein BGZ63DRAFT_442379 [Mariannaea sp. PMI_226]